MKIIVSFLSVVLFACNPTSTLLNGDEESMGWSKRADIPDHLRIDARVLSHGDEAYLMPGRGGYRYGIEPEVLRYSNNEWSEVANFDGWANAGGHASWKNGDLIYLVGGINGGSAPTDEVVSFSISGHDFKNETNIPSGRRSSSCSCNTETKGYMGYGYGYNPRYELESDIWSYDFASGVWDAIPEPPVSDAIDFSLMTCKGNLVYLLFPGLETGNFYVLEEKTKKWTRLADFPGESRHWSVIVSNATSIYTGLGRSTFGDGCIHDDLWEYDIEKNEWVELERYPGSPFHSGFAFELNGDLFFGGGSTEITISGKSLNNELYRLRVAKQNQ